MDSSKKLWGHANGQEVYLTTISNGLMDVCISNFGCTVVSVWMSDKRGGKTNLVLGYPSLQHYITDPYYTGCIVGRFANRIANAAFSINGTTYKLAANEASGNHLHGGQSGFGKKVFDIVAATNNSIELYYKSAAGEEGYPGNLEVHVACRLSAANELEIAYKATTDAATHVNLTNHSYFNLSGNAASALQHELFINADAALVADADYIPTGALQAVAGTALDFRQWRTIGEPSFQGYNECFSIAATKGVAAALRDPASRRSMTVRTTLPGIMLYTGDFLGPPFYKNEGICLETQAFPDSPNRPEFPATLLLPGELYQHQTVYQFFDYFLP